MNKIILSSIVGVTVVVGASWYGYSMYQAKANPDYICTKEIYNSVCMPTSYSDWKNGTRTAYGTYRSSGIYSTSQYRCERTTTTRSSLISGQTEGTACSYTETAGTSNTTTPLSGTGNAISNGGTGGTVESQTN